MYSVNKTYLFAWILLFGLLDCYSQQSQSLQLLNQKQQIIDQSRATRVSAFANEKSIPISFNTTEGQHFLLVDIENGIPVYLSGLNSDAALTTGASRIQGGMLGLNVEGEGILIGVWDEGSVIDHVELGARVLSIEVIDSKTHASHVTGTLIASGINPLAKGMAPKATVTNWYFNNDLAEMSALARPDKTSLLLSNHSYGTVTGCTGINGEWVWTGNPSISTDED
jgi:hypothetical protein